MNSLLAIIIVSGFFILSGWYLTYLLPTIQKIERVGLSFLLGAGLTTFLWFLEYRLGLPLNLVRLALAGTILVLCGYFLTKWLKLSPLPYATRPFTRTEKYLALAVVVLLIAAFAIGSYNPLTAWDSIALYDFRGHAIAMNHDLRDITSLSYYVSYPLMISLVHSATYQLGGINAQGIHAVIFAAFIAIIYGRMQAWTNRKYALITCLLVILQNEIFSHATFAYTNLPYTTYLVTGFLYAMSWTKKKSISPYFLLVSGLLIGLSGWVRSAEVFWLLGLILIAWQGIRQKKWAIPLIATGIVALMRFAWSSFVDQVLVSLHIPLAPRINYVTLQALQEIIRNRQEIANYLYNNVFYPYQGIWFLAVPMAIALYLKRNLRLCMFLSVIVLSAGIVIAGVMVFSTYYATWNQIGDSARRMMLFITPFSLIGAVYTWSKYATKGKNDK